MENEEFYVVYRSNRAGDTWKVQGVVASEGAARDTAVKLLQQEANRVVRVLQPVSEFTSSVVVNERRF